MALFDRSTKMAEATAQPVAPSKPDDIDAQVGALLAEVDNATDQAKRSLNEVQSHANAALDAQVDAALRSAQANPAQTLAASPAPAAQHAVRSEPATVAQTALGKPAASGAPNDQISQLDQMLARKAEQIAIESDDDFDDPSSVITDRPEASASSTPPTYAASPQHQSPAKPPAPVVTPDPAPPVSEPADSAAATPETRATPSPGIPNEPADELPAPATAKPPPETAKPAAQSRPPAPSAAPASAATTQTPAANSVAAESPHSSAPRRSIPFVGLLEPLAIRLGRLSPVAQQTIGWVALLTFFHAVVVWAYVLLKGPPEPGIPIGPQPTLEGPKEHPESVRLRAEAARKAEEAEAASAHAKSGHGDGKSEAKEAKKEEKPPAKSAEKHGGGH